LLVKKLKFPRINSKITLSGIALTIFIFHPHQTIAKLHQNSASEQLQRAPSPGQKQTSFAEEPVPDLPQTALIPTIFGVL
jgi:hypothetical protein